jgi:hypothetical protein
MALKALIPISSELCELTGIRKPNSLAAIVNQVRNDDQLLSSQIAASRTLGRRCQANLT